MISKLTVQNVKCFDYQEFLLSDLTVFCGANSAGKSTALQCILALRQTFNEDRFASSELALIGEYFSFGHVSDLIFHGANEKVLSIALDNLNFTAHLPQIDRESYRMPFDSLSSYEHALFERDFVYLSAERLGPRNSYDVSFDTTRINVGIFGEFAMSEFIKRASVSALNQRLVQLSCADDTSTLNAAGATGEVLTLEVAVKRVMRKICPGFDIDYQAHKTVDRVSNTYSSLSTKSSVRPTNTGFGVSYVFPIIVAAFCVREGGTFIIENPEVHLHPQAQSTLANFLAQLSVSGVQVIIETHSDHIINGIRVFAKDHDLLNSHILINSIGKIDEKRDVKIIRVDDDGNLDDFHEGFFDQAQKDLLRLF